MDYVADAVGTFVGVCGGIVGMRSGAAGVRM